MEGADWTAVIIEDDPDVRDLIDLVLSQSGFRTVLSDDGLEGVDPVRRHNPLITTLDVNMPGMDGFAVAKRLREFSNTYLIFITARGDEIDVVTGFEAGADSPGQEEDESHGEDRDECFLERVVRVIGLAWFASVVGPGPRGRDAVSLDQVEV